MIVARNIEEQLQTQIMTLLELETYIIANSIPVRDWFNISEELIGRQIIVHANSATPTIMNEQGEAKEYQVQIDLLSYIHNTEDETPGAELSTLYQMLVGFTEQVAIATIQAGVTKLIINGKNTDVYAEEYDERFYTKVASFSLFVETV